MAETFEVALRARTDLKSFGSNAILLFALQIRYEIEDILSVAVESLTDGNDDKKCDLVFIDRDFGVAIVAQGYHSDKIEKTSAPSNKASDLNTAAGWLLTRPVNELPERLQSAAKELREAIESGAIHSLYFWYVHNLPESENVQEELKTVENTVAGAIQRNFDSAEIQEISAIEVGRNTLNEWYEAINAPIRVSETFNIPINHGYSTSSDDWKAYVTMVQASWLYDMLKRYKDSLFSANVRGYLGSRNSDLNINNGIKITCTDDPGHFWVYNNGITALVHEFQEVKSPRGKKLQIQGISIVNGAQTTGSIGSLESRPTGEAMVQARFVMCSNMNTVRKIIEYNNKQNKIEASDYRSNDQIQVRLRKEFDAIGHIIYLGGRRGGHEDLIKRRPNHIPSDTAAQTLAAFHGDPVTAYNDKSKIWISDNLYSKYFNDNTTAAHILFSYSLLRAIEQRKLDLLAKVKNDESLSDDEQSTLRFLRQRGAVYLLLAAIAKCLEIFLGKPVSSLSKTRFKENINLQKGQEIWMPIVETSLSMSEQLFPAVENGLKIESQQKSIGDFRSLISATKLANASLYKRFSDKIST